MKTGGSRKCSEYGGRRGRREVFHNLQRVWWANDVTDEEDDVTDVTDEEENSPPGRR